MLLQVIQPVPRSWVVSSLMKRKGCPPASGHRMQSQAHLSGATAAMFLVMRRLLGARFSSICSHWRSMAATSVWMPGSPLPRRFCALNSSTMEGISTLQAGRSSWSTGRPRPVWVTHAAGSAADRPAAVHDSTCCSQGPAIAGQWSSKSPVHAGFTWLGQAMSACL